MPRRFFYSKRVEYSSNSTVAGAVPQLMSFQCNSALAPPSLSWYSPPIWSCHSASPEWLYRRSDGRYVPRLKNCRRTQELPVETSDTYKIRHMVRQLSGFIAVLPVTAAPAGTSVAETTRYCGPRSSGATTVAVTVMVALAVPASAGLESLMPAMTMMAIRKTNRKLLCRVMGSSSSDGCQRARLHGYDTTFYRSCQYKYTLFIINTAFSSAFL